MKIKAWLVTFFSVYLTTFFITLFFTPHILMRALNFKAYLNDNHGVLQVRPQAEAGKDNIVRMSPDLLYSVCTFDLSKGPLQITAQKTNQYMSVSFFASNSDNFFVLNDKQIDENFNLVIATADMEIALPKNSKLVEAPSEYGLVLIRYYLADMAVSEIDAIRNQASCHFI